MSECVVRMDFPKRCYECDMANGLTCMATGGTYGRDVPKMTWIRGKPDWCPIVCQLPEGHGDLIDRDVLLQTFQNADYETYNDYCEAFDTTEAAETIVPAERSET